MAKVFRQIYHKISSSWEFKHALKVVDMDSLTYTVKRNQYDYYEFLVTYKSAYSYSIKDFLIIYDAENDEIISGFDYNYSGAEVFIFTAFINYAHKNLTTDLLKKTVSVTLYSSINCKNDEYHQKKYLNIHFQIEGMYKKNNNVIKIYFKNIEDTFFSNFFNMLSSLSEKEKSLDGWIDYLKLKDSVYKYFSAEELLFFRNLYLEKRSIGTKNLYISVTKESFVKLIPHLKNLQEKFSIYETGEKLIFAEQAMSLNLLVSQIDSDNYSVKISDSTLIHQYFVNLSSFILINNTIYKINLPFNHKSTVDLFEDKLFIKKIDLIYFKTVVSKQLSLFNNYLDFEEGIKFPEIVENTPEVYFIIEINKNQKNTLSVHSYLEYSDSNKLPTTMVCYQTNLIKFDQNNSSSWYFISDDLLYDLNTFLKNELFFDFENNPDYEWTISNDYHISHLKTRLFEKANPEWHILISDEINKDFVKTVNLIPEITINTDENIDWFSYKVIYKYHDIEISQDILRKFFNSGDKFLKAPDGSNLSIANREVFDEIEELIQYSQKDADHFHKAAIYRLPWIYELSKINPAINIYGDDYLQKMYLALQSRTLPEHLLPHYSLKPIMRTYQKTGYEWLKMLEKYKLNGILADDMGLGKTLQAISVLTDLPQDSKSLIICPKTLLFNWAAEIEKFNPQLKYLIYEGNKDERINLLRTVPVQIILCSYSIIQNDLEEFKKTTFDYLILDEAQHIKNHVTLRSKAVKKLKARHKLAMTGTPLENSVAELWSVFDFLMPGYLPALKKFKEFLQDNDKVKKQPDRIKKYIAPFILRRKKQDVLIELPDKQEQAIYCPMTEKQEKHYIQVLTALKQDVFKDGEENANYITMLAALTRLRQICDHPGLINEEWLDETDISGKVDTLKELVEDAIENDRKILIFSQYVKMLKLIEKIIKKMNIKYEYMDGSTKDRKTIINHFNDNEKVKVFLISLKTGGFGINLTSADTVILVDPWWNPMVENQAIDRVHRMGQTKKVLVYKLITIGSVEEKIMVLQKKKRDLFENIIDQGEGVLKSLEYDEIRSLFEYKE